MARYIMLLSLLFICWNPASADQKAELAQKELETAANDLKLVVSTDTRIGVDNLKNDTSSNVPLTV